MPDLGSLNVLLLGLWGSAFYYLRALPMRGLAWLGHRMTVTMELSQDNDWETHRWFTLWLSENPEVRRKLRAFRPRFVDGGGNRPTYVSGSGGPERRVRTEPVMAMGDVALVLHWRGLRLLVSHRLEKNEKESRSIPRSVYQITLWRGSRALLVELLDEGRALAEQESDGKVEVFTSMGVGWEHEARIAKRSPETLILRSGLKELLLTDAVRFLASAAPYRRRGVPWRRGWLLSGPPGTGKSTLALVIASILDLPIYRLRPSACSDGTLGLLLSRMPERALLLVEDIDSAVNPSDRPESKAFAREAARQMNAPPDIHIGLENGVTLSGLLNALDGVGASEGRLLVCTTNHPEKLPASLLRAGRLDLKEELGPLDAGQVAAFAALWETSLDVEAWVGRSPAELQVYLLAGLEVGPEPAEVAA